LREAGQYLSERFQTVTHYGVLEHAIVRLMAAAESGLAKDAAATEQVERRELKASPEGLACPTCGGGGLRPK
jgi:hypothetical protein